jgi:hypothetical protein
MKYSRKLEHLYNKSLYIAEYYNTISNLPFIIFGLSRLYELYQFHEDVCLDYYECKLITLNMLYTLYILYTFFGICSGIHHAFYFKYSIIIDYIPITLTIIYFIMNPFLFYLISFTSYIKLFISFLTLVSDHLYTPIPVPFGHVLWHLLASYSIDSAYQDIVFTFWIQVNN